MRNRGTGRDLNNVEMQRGTEGRFSTVANHNNILAVILN